RVLRPGPGAAAPRRAGGARRQAQAAADRAPGGRRRPADAGVGGTARLRDGGPPVPPLARRDHVLRALRKRDPELPHRGAGGGAVLPGWAVVPLPMVVCLMRPLVLGALDYSPFIGAGIGYTVVAVLLLVVLGDLCFALRNG